MDYLITHIKPNNFWERYRSWGNLVWCTITISPRSCLTLSCPCQRRDTLKSTTLYFLSWTTCHLIFINCFKAKMYNSEMNTLPPFYTICYVVSTLFILLVFYTEIWSQTTFWLTTSVALKFVISGYQELKNSLLK